MKKIIAIPIGLFLLGGIAVLAINSNLIKKNPSEPPKSIPDSDVLSEPQESIPDTSGNWDIIKKYITSTYPISENYFDAHFKFLSIAPKESIPGDNDSDGKEFRMLFPNATRVNYVFSLIDTDRKIHNLKNKIHLRSNKVIEPKDLPPVPLQRDSHDWIYPTKELENILSKMGAIKIAESNVECTDKDYFFDITDTKNKLSLVFEAGKIYWNWQGGQSYCHIDAESGEIDVYKVRLSDLI